MLIKKQYVNWILDAGLLAGFFAAFFLDFTGLELHQWLGVGLALMAGIHLCLHWKWVKTVTAILFSAAGTRTRDYYLVNASLLGGFFMLLATGLSISTWLNLDTAWYPVWRDIHVVAAISTLLVVVLKIGMHWRWIVATAQRMFTRKPRSMPQRRLPGGAPTPLAVPVSASRPRVLTRRHFMGLMGLVGMSAWVAISNLFKAEETVQAEALPEDFEQANAALSASQGAQIGEADVRQTPQVTAAAAQAAATPTPSTSAPTGSSSGAGCRVQCSKRCSYPGKCRKYVDRDKNKKCDLGECL